MEYAITFKLSLLTFLIICSGFFSGSEASYFSLTSLHLHKMREDRTPFYSIVQKLSYFPRRLLVTILVGNDSINVAISALTTSIFIYFFGEKGKWGAIIITTIVLIILGEAIPKTFAVIYPRTFACAASLPLLLFSKVVFPIVWILEKISDFFVAISSREGEELHETLTEDDFKTLVDAGLEEGALETSQRDLIHRVFELTDTKVMDVMMPRMTMFCLPISMPPQEMELEIIKSRHSRIPIYGDNKDDILGILHAKHFLAERWRTKTVKNIKLILEKPHFVPEKKGAHGMLVDFQARKMQMAIVVDEYGGVAGLVTLTDILESLFGEFYDEFGMKEEPVRRISDDTYIISGLLDIEDFNNLIGTAISTDDFDTIGGFAFHLFGEMPEKGDGVVYEGYTLRAEKTFKNRILTIRVTKNREQQPDE